MRIGAVVVTCEHGGNRVPRGYRRLFEGRRALLHSHRGWDPGALELARGLSRRIGAPLFFSTTTRLLVDLNRSVGSPTLFSSATLGLGENERAEILATHYHPYRMEVEGAVQRGLDAAGAGGVVLHLSVHTFTPVLRGVRRRADVGLLFDPARREEAAFCEAWQRAFPPRPSGRGLAVHLNEPYSGADDGLTTALRGRMPRGRYLGIELEVNQRFPRRGGRGWRAVCEVIGESLERVLAERGQGQPGVGSRAIG